MGNDNTKQGRTAYTPAQPRKGNASTNETGYGYQPLAQHTGSGLRPGPNTGFKLRHMGKLMLLLAGAALLGITLWGGMASIPTRRRLGPKPETINYPDGSVYYGDVSNGQPDGRGRLTWKDGTDDYSEGEWKDSTFLSGEGQRTYTSGNPRVYYGELWKNKLHGQGKITWTSGNTYEGQFENGHRTEGKMVYSDGRVYDGHWSKGKRNGAGVMTRRNGDIYNGQWVEGKQQGQGEFTWKDSSAYGAPVVYTGGYANDLAHGQGKLSYHNRGYYEGQFEDGNKTNGKAVYLDESLTYRFFEGKWTDSVGHGKMTHRDGRVEEGQLREGEFIQAFNERNESYINAATKTFKAKSDTVPVDNLKIDSGLVARLKARMAKTFAEESKPKGVKHSGPDIPRDEESDESSPDHDPHDGVSAPRPFRVGCRVRTTQVLDSARPIGSTGIIMPKRDGKLRVKWDDKKIQKIAPSAYNKIERIPEHDESTPEQDSVDESTPKQDLVKDVTKFGGSKL